MHPPRRRLLPWTLAGVACAALATVLFMWAPWRAAPVDDRQIHFSIVTPDTLGGASALNVVAGQSPRGILRWRRAEEDRRHRRSAAESLRRGHLPRCLGTRDATLVFESPEVLKFIDDWSPDGRFLLFHTLVPSKLYAVPLSGDRKPVLLAQAQKTIDSPHSSPDSKWVSYNTDESGASET